ncbi:hypothetical protein [Hymenobacter sp.]|jgi:hypothetical protein|uniref:hypothetical protein n=1 Tax=Hymenobacter sp. TaxID=1898978 RepID=UPI002ED8AA5E
MKQPKKRWAWTARQRNRISYFHDNWRYNSPSGEFIRLKWKTHRSQTRAGLHQILRAADEAATHFPYQHRHSGWWKWS